jgi:CBS domain-containing protein
MRMNVTVKEIMKIEVKTVSLDDTIEKAAQIMKKNKISSVVVIGDKNVKGILTDSDVVYKYVADRKQPGTKVADIMTRDPIIITPDKTIEDAARLMSEKNIKKLLVMDHGKMVGIVTDTDIMKIEPALFEILLERMKIRGPAVKEAPSALVQCEMCGNYTDDAKEVDGVWLCSECADLE